MTYKQLGLLSTLPIVIVYVNDTNQNIIPVKKGEIPRIGGRMSTNTGSLEFVVVLFGTGQQSILLLRT